MATPDQDKDVLESSDTTKSAESQEIHESDLQSVTGGLPNSMGTSLSSMNTAVCVSSD